jgi:DHA2 family multidrug resistance protein
MSLLDIPREKMAQASGLTNIIRQLGGSFGVAILATLLSSRVDYHSQTFGEAIIPNSETFRNTSAQVSYYMQREGGTSAANSIKISQSMIAAQIGKEAFIQAVDDDFLIAGLITLLGGIPVLWLSRKKQKIKAGAPAEILD